MSAESVPTNHRRARTPAVFAETETEGGPLRGLVQHGNTDLCAGIDLMVELLGGLPAPPGGCAVRLPL